MSTLNSNTLSALSAHNIKLDRIIDDNLKLPNDMYDLSVKPNELITSTIFNNTIRKIDKNFTYLIRSSSIANTDIPINKTSNPLVVYKNDGGFYIKHNNSTANNIPNLASSLLVPNPSLSSIGTIISTDKYILLGVLSGDRMADISEESLRELYSSNRVSEIKTNKKTFQKIISTSHSNNMLYVLDSGTTQPPGLYSYDITGITENNPYILNQYTKGRKLLKSIGGEGSVVEDISSLKSPICVYSNNNNVYVIDEEPLHEFGGYIKEYDNDLNFVNLYDLTVHFKNYRPVDMISNNNELIILTNSATSKRGYIIIYDKIKKQVSDVIPLDKNITNKYISITQSPSDTNIIYMSTTKELVKKFKSRLDKTIGQFQITDTVQGKYKSVDVIQSYDSTHGVNSDEIIISSSRDIHLITNESVNYKSIMYSSFDVNVLPRSNINVHPEEFVNHFIFNKIFSKLLYNHSVLRESIRMKFIGQYNTKTKLTDLSISYINPYSKQIKQLYEYTESLNNYVGINEPIITSVINRCIQQIYDMQLLLLDCIQSNILYTMSNSIRLETAPGQSNQIPPLGQNNTTQSDTYTDPAVFSMPNTGNTSIY